MRIFVKIPHSLDLERPVLAWLDHRDFARARERASSFAAWRNYEEFLTERDALSLNYGVAGVVTTQQRVAFPAFERWSRLTGAALDLDGLDEFATHWRWRRLHPDAPAYGVFADSGRPRRRGAELAGAQAVRVCPQVFARWREDYSRLAMFNTPTLDAYAALVVENCLPSRFRARRPAVNSE